MSMPCSAFSCPALRNASHATRSRPNGASQSQPSGPKAIRGWPSCLRWTPAEARPQWRRVGLGGQSELACQPGVAAGSVNRPARPHVALGKAHPGHPAVFVQQSSDLAPHQQAGAARADGILHHLLQQRAIDLKAAPRTICVGTIGLKMPLAGMLHPYAAMTVEAGVAQGASHPQVLEQDFGSRMQGLARRQPRRQSLLYQCDAQSALSCADRRGTAGRACAQNEQVATDHAG